MQQSIFYLHFLCSMSPHKYAQTPNYVYIADLTIKNLIKSEMPWWWFWLQDIIIVSSFKEEGHGGKLKDTWVGGKRPLFWDQ